MFAKSFVLAAIAASAAAAPVFSVGGGAGASAGFGLTGVSTTSQTFESVSAGAGAGAGATVGGPSKNGLLGSVTNGLHKRHDKPAVAGQSLAALPLPQGFPVALPAEVLSGLKEIEIEVEIDLLKKVFVELEVELDGLQVEVEAKVGVQGVSLFDVTDHVDKLFGLLGGVVGKIQALPKAASPATITADQQVELAQLVGAVVAKVSGTVEKLEVVPGAAALLAGIDAKLSLVLNIVGGVVSSVLGLVGQVLSVVGVAVTSVLYRAGGIVFGLLNGVTGNILSCGCN